MTKETNSKLGVSTPALTQIISNPGIRAYIVVDCHNKFQFKISWNDDLAVAWKNEMDEDIGV